MKRFLAAIVLIGFLALGLKLTPSYAGEIDLLLQKLVEKGILTPGEAQQVKTETQEQVKKEIAQGKYSSLPQWVQTLKMKGDFRLRYQYDHMKRTVGVPAGTMGGPGTTDRNRARIRLRLGLESKVNDKINVGVGLCTGATAAGVAGADAARSPNQTLGESWSKKYIYLDYAYVQYTPKPWISFIGGKFKNPLWEPGDLIWDTDITPEGGAAQINYKLNPKLSLFANTGVLIIDENLGANNSDDDDPTMYVAQAGFNTSLTDTISLKTAASYYNASNVKNRTLRGTVGTNTNSTQGTAAGALFNDYATITPATELTITNPFKSISHIAPFMDIPYLAFFGEYVVNPQMRNPNDLKNTGFMGGMKFGSEKIEKWKDWQVRYNYAMLGRDAVMDILPDSDRYGGQTGIRAHETMFDFGLGKNTWLSLDYYYGWRLGRQSGATMPNETMPASVVQVDWNMKW
jgi:hypothetical protein